MRTFGTTRSRALVEYIVDIVCVRETHRVGGTTLLFVRQLEPERSRMYKVLFVKMTLWIYKNWSCRY